MKRLLTLLLLLPHTALAVDVTLELCASTGTYMTQGGCPPSISTTAGPNDDTTADADCTISGSSTTGTMHFCMDVAAETPTREECLNNSGIVDKSTLATTTAGTYTATGANTLTGLAETQYKVWCHHVITSGNYQNRPNYGTGVSATFTTNAAPGGGGPDITGAGLFVALADGGNTDETTVGDSGTSTSGCTQHFNSPCSEFSHLGTPTTGQDIFLCEGCVWEDRTYTINQNGNASNQAEISCYYNNAGTPNQCATFP